MNMLAYSFTFTGWSPAPRHRSPTPSRWGHGRLHGTCHGRLHARSCSVTMTRRRGTWSFVVHVCCESALLITVTPRPASSRDTTRSPRWLCAPGPTTPTRAPRLRECGRRRGRRGRGATSACGGSLWDLVRRVECPRSTGADPPVAVEVAEGDQNRVRALGCREQRLGNRWPVGWPAVVGGVGPVADRYPRRWRSGSCRPTMMRQLRSG